MIFDHFSNSLTFRLLLASSGLLGRRFLFLRLLILVHQVDLLIAHLCEIKFLALAVFLLTLRHGASLLEM